MEQVQGYIGVLVAIFAWGSYTIPLKSEKSLSPLWFQAWLSIGIGGSSLVIGVLRGFSHFSSWGIFAGLVWSIGAAGSFLAVQHEGLSGASTRWMGTGILVSFAIGAFLMQEPVAMAIALPGVVLLILGLLVVSKASEEKNQATLKINPLRYWRSIGAGMVFGSYLVPMQLAGIPSWDFIAPMGLGILLGGFVLLAFRPVATPRLRLTCVGCGLAWNCANIGSLLAVQSLGFAVGFPLTQLALLVSISWGVWRFGESPLPSQRRFLAIAAGCLLLGAGLLGFSRL